MIKSKVLNVLVLLSLLIMAVLPIAYPRSTLATGCDYLITDDYSGVANNNARILVEDSNGIFYTTYVTYSNPNYLIIVGNSTDDGHTWNLETVEITGNQSVSSSTLGIDTSDNLHLVYMKETTIYDEWWQPIGNYTSEIIYMERISGEWQEPVALSSVVGWYYYPAIAVSGNNSLHVVWSYDDCQIQYKERDGIIWQATENVTTYDADYDQLDPSIATDSSNHSHVAWDGFTSDSPNVVNIRYREKTTSWQSIMEITTGNTYYQQSPCIGISGNDTIGITWSGQTVSSADGYQIRFIRYTDSWQSIEEVTSDTYFYWTPSLSYESSTGHIYLTWKNDYTSYIGESEYTSSWSEPTSIINTASSSPNMLLTLSSGYVLVCDIDGVLSFHDNVNDTCPEPTPTPTPPPPSNYYPKNAYIISQLPDDNYGGEITVGYNSNPCTYRSLLGFDESFYAGSTIYSAILYLGMSGKAGDPTDVTIDCYKATKEGWIQDGVTWNDYTTGSAWDVAGGDYITSHPSGDSAVVPSGFALMSWNITGIVQDAVNNESGLVNLLLKYDSEIGDSYVNFYSFGSGYEEPYIDIIASVPGPSPTPTPPPFTGTIIYNVEDLQNMDINKNESYKLGGNISCEESWTWNNGRGFAPIGMSEKQTKTTNLYYDTSYGQNSQPWVEAQTFLALSDRTTYTAQIIIKRTGTWGNVTLSIQGIDEYGYPDGNILASDIQNWANIPTTFCCYWMEFYWDSPYQFTRGTQYALVLSHAGGVATYWQGTNYDNYYGGFEFHSADAGASWDYTTGGDLSFILDNPSMTNGDKSPWEYYNHLDGDGYTISDLYMDWRGAGSDYHDNIGLFSILNSSGAAETPITIIKDLTMDSAVIYGVANVGVVIGYYKDIHHGINNVDIVNSYVEGEQAVGGVVGAMYYVNDSMFIANCSFDGSTVVSTYRSVGGIVGLLINSYEDLSVIIGSCVFAGNATVSGYGEVGGIIGYAIGDMTVSNCNSYGWVSAVGSSNAGGIIGLSEDSYPQLKSPDITLCNSFSEVSGNLYIGGIVGCSRGDGNITRCYAGGNITGTDGDIGGIAGAAGSLYDNYYFGNITGGSVVGGIAGGASYLGNNTAVANITSDGGEVGGIVGGVSTGGKIINCVFNGNITLNGSGINCGGIYGGDGGYLDVDVYDCVAVGTITGPSFDNIGGIVGSYVQTIPDTLSNCSANMEIIGHNNCGGLVGYAGHVSIENSYSIGNVTCNSYGGGLVGYLTVMGSSPGGTLSDSFSTGNVSVAIGPAGGLVGYNDDIIERCYSTGNVYAVDSGGGVGGLVGVLYEGNITDCWSSGNVTTADTINSDAGGLIGAAYTSTITASYSVGNVTGYGDYAGGFIGYSEYISIDRCFSYGSVSTTGVGAVGDVGGFAGYSNLGNITNCFARGDAHSDDATWGVAGFIGYNDGMTITYCYSTGNVTANSGSAVGGFAGIDHGGTYRTTIDIYPSVTGYVDVYVPGGLSWSSLRAYNNDANITAYTDSGSYNYLNFRPDTSTTDMWDKNSRTFMFFDTSVLPNNAVIESSNLFLSVVNAGDYLGVSPDIVATEATTGSNSSIVTADYYNNVGGTKITDAYSWPDFPLALTLNPTGLSYINKTGLTKVAIVNGNYDVDNVAPAWIDNSEDFLIWSTTHLDSYLSITYTDNPDIPTGGTYNGCFWDIQTSGLLTTAGTASGNTTAVLHNINTFKNAGWDISYK